MAFYRVDFYVNRIFNRGALFPDNMAGVEYIAARPESARHTYKVL